MSEVQSLEKILTDSLTQPFQEQRNDENNRVLVLALQTHFDQLQQTDTNDIEGVAEVVHSLNKALTNPNIDLDQQQREVFVNDFLRNAEFSLKKAFTENSDSEEKKSLRLFKTFNDMLKMESKLVKLKHSIESIQRQNEKTFLDKLKVDFFADKNKKETQTLLYKRVTIINKVFLNYERLKADDIMRLKRKLFFRWHIKSNKFIIKDALEKILLKNWISKESAIWRLKKLISISQINKKMPFLHLIETIETKINFAVIRINRRMAKKFMNRLLLNITGGLVDGSDMFTDSEEESMAIKDISEADIEASKPLKRHRSEIIVENTKRRLTTKIMHFMVNFKNLEEMKKLNDNKKSIMLIVFMRSQEYKKMFAFRLLRMRKQSKLKRNMKSIKIIERALSLKTRNFFAMLYRNAFSFAKDEKYLRYLDLLKCKSGSKHVFNVVREKRKKDNWEMGLWKLVYLFNRLKNGNVKKLENIYTKDHEFKKMVTKFRYSMVVSKNLKLIRLSMIINQEIKEQLFDSFRAVLVFSRWKKSHEEIVDNAEERNDDNDEKNKWGFFNIVNDQDGEEKERKVSFGKICSKIENKAKVDMYDSVAALLKHNNYKINSKISGLVLKNVFEEIQEKAGISKDRIRPADLNETRTVYNRELERIDVRNNFFIEQQQQERTVMATNLEIKRKNIIIETNLLYLYTLLRKKSINDIKKAHLFLKQKKEKELIKKFIHRYLARTMNKEIRNYRINRPIPKNRYKEVKNKSDFILYNANKKLQKHNKTLYNDKSKAIKVMRGFRWIIQVSDFNDADMIAKAFWLIAKKAGAEIFKKSIINALMFNFKHKMNKTLFHLIDNKKQLEELYSLSKQLRLKKGFNFVKGRLALKKRNIFNILKGLLDKKDTRSQFYIKKRQKNKLMSKLVNTCNTKTSLALGLFKENKSKKKLEEKRLRSMFAVAIRKYDNKLGSCFKDIRWPNWREKKKTSAVLLLNRTLQPKIERNKLVSLTALKRNCSTLFTRKLKQFMFLVKEKINKQKVAPFYKIKYLSSAGPLKEHHNLVAFNLLKSFRKRKIRNLFELSFFKLLIHNSHRQTSLFQFEEQKLEDQLNNSELRTRFRTKQQRELTTALKTLSFEINAKNLRYENLGLKRLLILEGRKRLLSEMDELTQTKQRLLNYLDSQVVFLSKVKDISGGVLDTDGSIDRSFSKLQETMSMGFENLEVSRNRLVSDSLLARSRVYGFSPAFSITTINSFRFNGDNDKEITEKIKALMAEKAVLEEKLNDVRREREEYEDYLADFENEEEGLTKTIALLQNAKESLENDLNRFSQNNQDILHQNEDMTVAIGDIVAALADLKNEIAELEARLEELTSLEGVKKNEAGLIKDQQTTLKEMEAELDNRIAEFSQKNQAIVQELMEFNKNKNETGKQLSELKQHNIDLGVTVQKIDNELASVSNQIRGVDSITDQLRNENLYLQSHQKSLDLPSETKPATRSKRDLARLSAKNDEMSAIITKMSIIDDNIEKNNSEIEIQQFQLSELNNKEQDLLGTRQMKEQEVRNNDSLIREHMTKIEGFNTHMMALEKDLEKNADDIQKIFQEKEGLIAKENQLVNYFETCNADLEEVGIDIEKCRAELETKQELLSSLQAELDIVNEQSEYNKNSVLELLEEKRRTEELLADKNNKLREYAEQKEKVNNQLNDVKLDILNIEKQGTEVDNEVKNKDDEINVLRSKLKNNTIQNSFSIQMQEPRSRFIATAPLNNIVEKSFEVESNRNIINQKAFGVFFEKVDFSNIHRLVKNTHNDLKETNEAMEKNNKELENTQNALLTVEREIRNQERIIDKNHQELLLLQNNLAAVMGMKEELARLRKRERLRTQRISLYRPPRKEIDVKKIMREINTKLRIATKVLQVFFDIRTINSKRRAYEDLKDQFFVFEAKTLDTDDFNVLAVEKTEELTPERLEGVYQLLGLLKRKEQSNNREAIRKFKQILNKDKQQGNMKNMMDFKRLCLAAMKKKANFSKQKTKNSIFIILKDLFDRNVLSVFKKLQVSASDKRLQALRRYFLPLVFKAERKAKINLKEILRTWFIKRTENKWFYRIFRALIMKSSLSPQIAFWRLVLHKPTTKIVDANLRLKLFRLRDLAKWLEENRLLEALWALEKNATNVDGSLFDSEQRNTGSVNYYHDRLHNPDLAVSEEYPSSLDFSDETPRVGDIFEDEKRMKQLREMAQKEFIKKMIFVMKKKVTAAFHKLHYFYMKKQRVTNASLNQSLLLNTHKNSLNHKLKLPQYFNELESSIGFLVDQNVGIKKLVDEKEERIKELEEGDRETMDDLTFLKHSFVFRQVYRVDKMMRRCEKREVLFAFEMIKG